MEERRPRVSLNGTIKYGISEDEKRLIESHGLDPDKCIIVRNNTDNMLLRIDEKYYLLWKEGETNGRGQVGKADHGYV